MMAYRGPLPDVLNERPTMTLPQRDRWLAMQAAVVMANPTVEAARTLSWDWRLTSAPAGPAGGGRRDGPF